MLPTKTSQNLWLTGLPVNLDMNYEIGVNCDAQAVTVSGRSAFFEPVYPLASYEQPFRRVGGQNYRGAYP